MLQITDLHAHLAEEDKTILKGVNLTVNNGEIHLLLGPNGSGKSTLGKVLLGDEKYDVEEGEIVFANQDFLELEPDERAKMGYFLAFQSPPAVVGLSAKEVLLAAKRKQTEETVSGLRFTKQLKQNLATLHLSDSFLTRDLHSGASGGEKRKMEIASLLSLNPKLAFLDEVDSGVDIDGLKAIGEAISAFMGDNNEKSLILVSHGKEILKYIQPTHVHVMVHGRIVETGSSDLIEKIHKNGFLPYLLQAS